MQNHDSDGKRADGPTIDALAMTEQLAHQASISDGLAMGRPATYRRHAGELAALLREAHDA